ncbi:MAG TPA: D-alanyl-D-alanine carboxypeptidase [Candidatus Flavonifractor intestinipullorum]|uniref:D-alanyl-D-alanine carboxypeptidase n=1 Tax=Candidatus Flavonifractor intestinipullorum TaxID=2838587 RepID=A0A9D2S6N4_9FIRM|nr:D-alanyl-D-alanine carboxypeptidase [Candidatus Flavonifractor intestinipullorum]
MKRMCAALLALMLLSGGARAAGPVVSARSAILVDGDTGRVLWSHNAGERLPIASTTKLMTALVALESGVPLKARVEIKAPWTGIEGSSMYLRAGETLTLEELLYGVLLVSGNDAATAVAGACAGDVETFVAQMNQKAAELGMADTHFTTPSGLEDEGNYSTAADMAKLARAVLERETLVEIASTKSITLAGRTLVNHNKLLGQYDGCLGLKTGYTQQAGRTLVSAARREGETRIVVTLNDRNDWADHAALLDYGFSGWSRATLAHAGETLARVPVTGSLIPFLPAAAAETVCYPLAPEEEVRRELELPAQAPAPLEAGETAGRVRFYVGEALVGESALVWAGGAQDDRTGGRRWYDWLEEFWLGLA